MRNTSAGGLRFMPVAPRRGDLLTRWGYLIPRTRMSDTHAHTPSASVSPAVRQRPAPSPTAPAESATFPRCHPAGPPAASAAVLGSSATPAPTFAVAGCPTGTRVRKSAARRRVPSCAVWRASGTAVTRGLVGRCDGRLDPREERRVDRYDFDLANPVW
jgi:hypothetical protein